MAWVSIMETSCPLAPLPSSLPPIKLLFCVSVASGSCFLLYQEEARGLQWESKRFPALTKYRCSGSGALLWLGERELLGSRAVSCLQEAPLTPRCLPACLTPNVPGNNLTSYLRYGPASLNHQLLDCTTHRLYKRILRKNTIMSPT